MKNIDEILDNYFEGKSSLDDEKLLRDYFSQSNIAERHKMYAPLFHYFTEEIEKQNTPLIKAKSNRRRAIIPYISIAATIALLITAGLTFNAKSDEASQSIVYVDGKKISDKDIIYNQTLESIDEAAQMDYELLDSQIDILNSFTE